MNGQPRGSVRSTADFVSPDASGRVVPFIPFFKPQIKANRGPRFRGGARGQGEAERKATSV